MNVREHSLRELSNLYDSMIQQRFSLSNYINSLEFLNVYIYETTRIDFRVQRDFCLAEDIELKEQRTNWYLSDIFQIDICVLTTFTGIVFRTQSNINYGQFSQKS